MTNPEPVNKPPKQTKKAKLIELLSGERATTLDDLSSILLWQRHTTSAAVTRLKQEGFDVVSEKVDKIRTYRIKAQEKV